MAGSQMGQVKKTPPPGRPFRDLELFGQGPGVGIAILLDFGLEP